MNHIFSVREAFEDDAAPLLALGQAVFEKTEYMLANPLEFKDSVDDLRNSYMGSLGGRTASGDRFCKRTAELSIRPALVRRS